MQTPGEIPIISANPVQWSARTMNIIMHMLLISRASIPGITLSVRFLQSLLVLILGAPLCNFLFWLRKYRWSDGHQDWYPPLHHQFQHLIWYYTLWSHVRFPWLQSLLGAYRAFHPLRYFNVLKWKFTSRKNITHDLIPFIILLFPHICTSKLLRVEQSVTLA
jgi:hypothetical protein